MKITNEHQIVMDGGYLVPLRLGEAYDGHEAFCVSLREHISYFLRAVEEDRLEELTGTTQLVAPLKLFINGE